MKLTYHQKLILICCSVWFVAIIGRWVLYGNEWWKTDREVQDTLYCQNCNGKFDPKKTYVFDKSKLTVVDTIKNWFPNHSQIKR